MKLKINKACDIGSISVLPPQSRRLSALPSGLQASQAQLRSQTSQQSFSQGISSQHGMFSQLSQTSLDEALANDQRFNSQERENSAKRLSCLPPISHTREESQKPIARSSTNLMRKWNPSSVPDHKCQINEGLEHRIGMMETSLNKFGIVMDSVQSDVMQVHKGTKEISLEMDGMRQKFMALEFSMQLMNKGQEDLKFSLDGSLKSISEQLSKNIHQDKLQQIFLVLSTLPEKMEASLLKLQNELHITFTKEIQAMSCSIKAQNSRSSSINMLPTKVTGCLAPPKRKLEPLEDPAMPAKICAQATVVPKVEMGGWKSVKVDRTTLTQRASQMQKHRGVPSVKQPMMQQTQSRIIIDSDEEIDGGFSCLINEKESGVGNYMIDEAEEETERILKKARRRKRKHNNTIIIN